MQRTIYILLKIKDRSLHHTLKINITLNHAKFNERKGKKNFENSLNMLISFVQNTVNSSLFNKSNTFTCIHFFLCLQSA